MNWFPWLLWLHIFGAIVAFGPSFAFPMIGSMGGKEPMHGNFAVRLTERISHRIVFPLAVVQGVTGLGLLLVSGRNLTDSKNLWLDLGIILWICALAFSYFVQTPRVAQMIEMTSTPPPPPGPGAAPSGPPPAVAAAVKKIQQGGMILMGLIVTIIFLMVVKPLS